MQSGGIPSLHVEGCVNCPRRHVMIMSPQSTTDSFSRTKGATTDQKRARLTALNPTPSPSNHVCTVTGKLHREAALADSDVDAIGQLVLPCCWIQGARPEVRFVLPSVVLEGLRSSQFTARGGPVKYADSLCLQSR
jgi:hypothetical protein